MVHIAILSCFVVGFIVLVEGTQTGTAKFKWLKKSESRWKWNKSKRENEMKKRIGMAMMEREREYEPSERIKRKKVTEWLGGEESEQTAQNEKKKRGNNGKAPNVARVQATELNENENKYVESKNKPKREQEWVFALRQFNFWLNGSNSNKGVRVVLFFFFFIVSILPLTLEIHATKRFTNLPHHKIHYFMHTHKMSAFHLFIHARLIFHNVVFFSLPAYSCLFLFYIVVLAISFISISLLLFTYGTDG